ncbi:S-layer homology domain-containing protein, partial [Planococcus sp. CAU13]|uniref:S-layer homology domain-containing protein n=1 Tax=Planococcus sp. CAU13 TaxID=1541197 RepID=UPI0009DE595C
YSDGTVRPNKPVTRAQAAIMIGRLMNLDETQKATPFRDVSAAHHASGYIAEAAKAGYIKGSENGNYRPNDPIIRGEMALIVERVFDLEFNSIMSFTDVSQDAYYSLAISRILAANITRGYPDNTFRPRQNVTRAQFAAFLARGLEPKFKNDAVIENSYQKDKTKAYTYRSADEEISVHRFVDVPDRNNLRLGFMWTAESNGEGYEYLELENNQLFAIGYPYSEFDKYLVYPVQVGKTFEVGLGDDPLKHTITGVNVTVKTPYKTFTNATEVTIQGGYKYYMVEGYATVKAIDSKGVVQSELVSVE